MKKLIPAILSFALALTSIVPIMAAETNEKYKMPEMLTGSIKEENENSILVMSGNGVDEKILKISDSTYLIDAVTGTPLKLKDRKGDQVIAYYGPIETKSMPPQSNAVAIICSLPMDYHAPYYARVEAIEKGDDFVKVTINNGAVIASIKNDVPISPFKTKNIVTIGNISVGTDLLLWSDTTTMSFPGSTNVTKAVILGTNSTMETNMTFSVSDKMVTDEAKGIMGKLPQFNNAQDKMLSDKLNQMVDNIYAAGTKEIMGKDGVKVQFSYETMIYEDYASYVIHTSISSGNSMSDTVNTIVLNTASMKMLMLQDVLGMNANKLANQYISKQISKAEEGAYFTDANQFDGIKSEPNFYIDKSGNVCIIFDKYSIAPGAAGTPVFAIPMNSVVNYEMPTGAAQMKNNTTMISLRQITQNFGYTLTWNASTKTAKISKGDEMHSITINNNMYKERQLESAPMLINGMTYVPLSYFEVILGGCYTATESTITLSMFK